jgi:hypothetical protein
MVLELGHVLAQDPYCAVVHRWAHGRSFPSWDFTAAMSRHEQAATGWVDSSQMRIATARDMR